MQLMKRGAIWHYAFTANGIRYRGSTRQSRKSEAHRVTMLEYEKVRDLEFYGDKPAIPIAEAMKNIVDSMDKKKTRTSYDLCRRKWLGLDRFSGKDVWSLPKGMSLHDLRQHHLDAHMNHRRAKGLRGNSIAVEVRFIQKVYNAHKTTYLATSDLEFRKPKAFVRKRFISPEEEEAITLCLVARGELGRMSRRKAYNLFLFLMDTGCRLEEALSIQWSDVDLTSGVAEVWRDKTDTISMVPLSDRLIANLKLRHGDSAPFVAMDYAVKKLRQAIHMVCNQDGRINHARGKVTIHSLRDTYVTRLEAKGMSLRQIGVLVGHSSIETTKKYAHTQQADIVGKAKLLING